MRKLRVPDEIANLIRRLSPQIKARLRAGLDEILRNPEIGKALQDELDGFRSHRVGKYRIVYSLESGDNITVALVGPRATIYQDILSWLKANKKQ